MKKSKHAAFSLVELIIVLAIIAVLLVVLVPRFTGYIDDARKTAARSDAAALLQAAELYVAEQERDGLAPQASITQADPVLSPYLKPLESGASYALTISKDPAGGYTITGTYSKGTLTVSIPELTVSDTTPVSP